MNQNRARKGIPAESERGENALGWSVQNLSDKTGLGAATIFRYEMADAVPLSRNDNMQKIQIAFEAAGIKLNGSADARPGARIGHVKGE